eukprot:1159328-Pelagomonas_calceolata.AAC.11
MSWGIEYSRQHQLHKSMNTTLMGLSFILTVLTRSLKNPNNAPTTTLHAFGAGQPATLRNKDTLACSNPGVLPTHDQQEIIFHTVLGQVDVPLCILALLMFSKNNHAQPENLSRALDPGLQMEAWQSRFLPAKQRNAATNCRDKEKVWLASERMQQQCT